MCIIKLHLYNNSHILPETMGVLTTPWIQDSCSTMKYFILQSVLVFHTTLTWGLPAPKPSNVEAANNVDTGSSQTVGGDCRVYLLPQVEGCVMGFIQQYDVYEDSDSRAKQSMTGNLCHSYGETLQCLHLAFLKCSPSNIHLNFMQAKLPHPSIMQDLCFTSHESEETDDFNEMESTTLRSTETTHKLLQTAVMDSKNSVENSRKIKIIVSEKLRTSSDTDTTTVSNHHQISSSKLQSKTGEKPHQRKYEQSPKKIEPRVSFLESDSIQKDLVYESEDTEYQSTSHDIQDSNTIQRAKLTGSTELMSKINSVDISDNSGSKSTSHSLMVLVFMVIASHIVIALLK